MSATASTLTMPYQASEVDPGRQDVTPCLAAPEPHLDIQWAPGDRCAVTALHQERIGTVIQVTVDNAIVVIDHGPTWVFARGELRLIPIQEAP